MTRKLALALTLGVGCFYATGASAAEMATTGAAEPAVATTELPAAPDYRVAGVAASALVTTETTEPAGSGWEVSVTPYGWLSGMKADIDTPQGEHIEVDESFFDILDALKFTFMGAMEARHGRFVTVHDVMFMSLGTSAGGDLGPGFVDVEVEMRLLSSAHLAGYRVVDKGPLFLDLMAGARITTIKAEVELSGPLASAERESSKTQIGPLIASRFRAPLGEKWGVEVYGDLGGFGVTADISWQLLGTVQYQVSDHWRLLAGWRHFHAEQDKDGFDIGISMDGPIIGASYRF